MGDVRCFPSSHYVVLHGTVTRKYSARTCPIKRPIVGELNIIWLSILNTIKEVQRLWKKICLRFKR